MTTRLVIISVIKKYKLYTVKNIYKNSYISIMMTDARFDQILPILQRVPLFFRSAHYCKASPIAQQLKITGQ